MTSHIRIDLTAAGIAAVASGGQARPTTQRSETSMETSSTLPSARAFTSAPLRNRLRLQLDASPEEVWSLIGDLERYPEYSGGLERVEVEMDSDDTHTGYVCYLRPQGKGGGIRHKEQFRWYEPDRGYASIAEEPNASGLTNALTLVTLERSNAGTTMTWVQHYDAEDLDMSQRVFDEALAEIGERLVARFGGRVAERCVEQLS